MDNNIIELVISELDLIDMDTKACKWKNLVFQKDGKSSLGIRTYDSEDKALDMIYEIEGEINEGFFGVIFTQRKEINFVDYSHTIQIPIKN